MAKAKQVPYRMVPHVLAELAGALASVGSAEEMERFLRDLLTDSELRDVTLRWQLLGLLAQGVPQRRIADGLQISLCKITRGSRILKRRDSVCARMLKRDREAPV
ncbi:MAG: trp operon repressor [Kiritimatiellaeota bacterium]|nr:trp operon repressor [Kiritimatiellota bacterium]